MTKKEINLLKRLCSFKSTEFDESLIDAATPTVLGHLFFNRMSAIAYGQLKEHKLLGKVNREFRNSLKCAYDQNVEKNKSFFSCVEYVGKVLSNCKCKYAMLKGAYLCKIYPEGYRTSNDIDILVHPRDIAIIGEALINADFKQGNIRNGKFVPATRKEVIESRIMRGETVPYIKEVNLPGMQFLEVDINFSLDYKPGDTKTLENMLERTIINEFKDFSVCTLSKEDFFVHLCCHLYKEATTLPWVEMKRDMTMYKYCDIYMILNDIGKNEADSIFKYAKKLGLAKECAFAVAQMSKLFDCENLYAITLSEDVLKTEPDFIHTVVAPKENKKYIFTEKDIFVRFIADDRKSMLREVKNDETVKDEAK